MTVIASDRPPPARGWSAPGGKAGPCPSGRRASSPAKKHGGFLAMTVKGLLFLSLFLAISDQAQAAFSLSVTPRRGGNHIRFEAAEPGGLLQNEEVTLAIASDEARQYQITQTMSQPLTNELGDTIPQGAFVVFSPSTTQGTLRTQVETPVTMGQNVIFTSNAAGTGESFILVFNAHVPENQSGGVYHTRITFQAELVNAATGISPSIRTLDVRLEIRPQFSIKIEGVEGGRSLDLGHIIKDRLVASAVLNIKIVSNVGTSFRILQQLNEPLISQDGQVLDENIFTMTGAHAGKGAMTLSGNSSPVSQTPVLIYTSNERGAGDTLQIDYNLEPDVSQRSGIYQGMLTFKAESNSPYAASMIINVPVHLQIDSIFYLNAEMEGGGSVYFGALRPGEDKQTRKVVLKVQSNLGKPYQVTQVVSRKLTNEEGAPVPEEFFVFSGVPADTGNLLVSRTASPVKEGESQVFISDNEGTPEKLVLTYELSIPVDLRSGSYSSEIKYSVTTL